MQFTTSAVRTILTASRRYALMAGVCAATCGLVACGSDTKTTTTTTGGTGTTTGSTTGGTATTGTTTSTTTGTPASSVCTVPNCDATIPGDLVLSATSPELMGQSSVSGSAPVNFKYALMQNSTVNAGTVKQFELSLLDYDACTFQWNHAQTADGTYNYSVFPTAKFSFGGVYLVNVTAGAALTPGTYTVNAAEGEPSVAIVDSAGTAIGGTGYDITSCSGGTYEGITSGTVKLTATDGTTIDGGSFDLVTTSYSNSSTGSISGAFLIGTCGGQSDTQPVAAQPDSNACVLSKTGSTTAG